MNKPWTPKKATFVNNASTPCRIWNLESKNEGGLTYVRLVDGIINGMAPANLNAWVEIQENGFLFLNISSAGGVIQSYSLEFSNSLPEPIGSLENLPPTTFKIFFARINNFNAVSRYCKALSILPEVARIVSQPPSQPGEDNSIRYYSWKINEV